MQKFTIGKLLPCFRRLFALAALLFAYQNPCKLICRSKRHRGHRRRGVFMTNAWLSDTIQPFYLSHPKLQFVENQGFIKREIYEHGSCKWDTEPGREPSTSISNYSFSSLYSWGNFITLLCPAINYLLQYCSKPTVVPRMQIKRVISGTQSLPV
jgi:hypothetical protein